MLFFDIETDGLLDKVTKGHCMVIIDGDNNDVYRFNPSRFWAGVSMLYDAINNGEQICGHNIINYDIPALHKLFPWFEVKREQRPLVIDTLVLARLIYGNIGDSDNGRIKSGKFPAKLKGRQSLKAWGYRLGELKGTYGEQEDAWSEFSESMLEYCVQDVVVTKKLYEYLTRYPYSERAITLEHEAQWLMSQQERNGFPFDIRKATELLLTLQARHAVLESEILKLFPCIPDKVFIPKRDNKTKGYKAGVPIQRYKDFNPSSRLHILWVLKDHFNYMPDNDELYEGDEDCKRLRIDGETFAFIKEDTAAPEELKELAAVFEEYLMVDKRLGQLANGSQAWLKHVKEDGRIHGSVNPCGAVSGRMTHSNPNLAQVPHVGSPYGEECRELFTVPKGWLQVGVDACGLELRCLAHFLAPYDGGAYGHEILNGDIHTANQLAAGLETRNEAKRFIYAFLYGGGDALIGKLLGGDASVGKSVKKKFLKGTPAIAKLRQAVEDTLVETHHGQVVRWKRRYLKGLDGRLLYVRSVHSAVNLLLQSAGALVCKKWGVLWEQNMVKAGYEHGKDFFWMATIHDESQIACRTQEIAEDAIRIAQDSMREAQAFFGFRCTLDTEGKIGANWYDCH